MTKYLIQKKEKHGSVDTKNMKKLKLILFLCGLVVTTFAQEKGIQFRDFNNWQAVLDASKKENKPIFIDFFTTWCGPCKLMDKEVYGDSLVGTYFNKNFISVKVQMDKATSDNDQIKKWYPEIVMLEKEYSITGYPTFVFISPEGYILYRKSGYESSERFINTASIALKSGQRYINPASKYYEVVREAKKSANEMSVVKVVNELVADEDLYFEEKYYVIDSLNRVSMAYLSKQPTSVLLNKEPLKLIGRIGITTDNVLFKFFYEEHDKIDHLVGQKYFARMIIDNSIQKKFFAKSKVNLDSIKKIIAAKYDEDYAQRAVEIQTVLRCFSPKTSDQFIESYLSFTEKYGIFYSQIILEELGMYLMDGSQSLEKMSHFTIDGFCERFLFPLSSSVKQLQRGARLLKAVVEDSERHQFFWFNDCADTYAHLLYAIGDKKQAIAIQTKALQFSIFRNEPKSEIETYQQALEDMQNGTVIWPLNDSKNAKK